MADKPVYRCIVTDVGAALEAQAKVSGVAVHLTHIAVGDGGGTVPEPEASATALVSEQHRRRIDTLAPDSDNPCILYASTTFPADVGGWWIREIGLYATTDDDPVLFAYGNHAPYHKTLSRDGQATEHTLSVPIITTSEATVTLVIDESSYVTKRELDSVQNLLLATHADQSKNMADLTFRLLALELREPSATTLVAVTGTTVTEAGSTISPIKIGTDPDDMGDSPVMLVLAEKNGDPS